MTFRLRGWQDMQRTLSRMDERVERKLGMKALRAGANFMARQIRKKLPVDPVGDDVRLKRSVKVRQTREAKRSRDLSLRIGYEGAARRYGHVVEYGGVTGGQVAQPVWRPAFVTHADGAIAKMADSLERDIAKELRSGR